jgi:predicted DNA-binding transcriptional regulator AlpA
MVTRVSASEEAPLLTPQGVADLLGLPSERSVYNRRHRGEFPPAIRLGRSLRWRRSDIDRYLEERLDAAVGGERG